MTKETLIAVRLDEKLVEKVEEMKRQTGLTQSALIRQLIRNAVIQPVSLSTTAKGTSPTTAPTLETTLAV